MKTKKHVYEVKGVIGKEDQEVLVAAVSLKEAVAICSSDIGMEHIYSAELNQADVYA